MTKVLTIVGTRPEIIKLSRVIAELEKQVNHILVHTGQNYDYELNEIFFEDFPKNLTLCFLLLIFLIKISSFKYKNEIRLSILCIFDFNFPKTFRERFIFA